MHFPIHRGPIRYRGPWALKRGLDLGLALIILLLVFPLIAITWLWIQGASPGSALFRQRRVGLNGKTFTIYKFRSMERDCSQVKHVEHVRRLARSGAPMTKLDVIGDDRLIPGGRLIRAMSLDELPQLINVLKGEMSLVGPRPCLPEEFELFTKEQRRRFDVPPGITGLWQVGGKNNTTFREMGQLDQYYALHASLWVDLAILARTPTAVLLQAHRQFSRRIPPITRQQARAGVPSTGGSLRN
jgi:lipopolysaccharide/colanic/teichoic acid biosynthesis glycosyltransferase